jgi:hypothetical protein
MEQGVQEAFAEEAGRPLAAIGAHKNRAVGVAPVGAKASSAAGTMEPFSGVEAREHFVRKRNIGTVIAGQFGLGAEPAAEQATAGGQVNRSTVAGFDGADVEPGKTKTF